MRDLKLQSPVRRLLDGWVFLVLAAAAIASAPALQVSTAHAPAMRLLPDAAAFRAAMLAYVTLALTILIPSLMAVLGIYAGAVVTEGRVYSLRLGRYGLGLSIVGGAILLACLLVYGPCVLCLTNSAVGLNSPVLYLAYALFAPGVLVTAVNFLLTMVHRVDLDRTPQPHGEFGIAAGCVVE